MPLNLVLRKYCFIYSKIKSMEIYMHNLNNITKILGTTLLLVGSSAALAQETLSVPATATVDNTIDFTLAGTLDFGTLRAQPGQTVAQCVALVVPANPGDATSAAITGTETAALCSGGAATDGVIQSVGGTIAVPVFTVAGLAAFTTLDVTVPLTAAAVTLALNPAPAGAGEFKLRDFTVYQSSGTPADVALSAGVGAIVAGGTGEIIFSVGATIITDVTATTPAYQNASYDGTFDVIVDFQ
jgi:hypothetical protein